MKSDISNIPHYDDWIQTLKRTFVRELSEGMWQALMQNRGQLPGESGTKYTLAKVALCRRRPTPMQEEEMIPFLIRGLYKLEQKIVMMGNPPMDLMGFIDEIQRLETLSGESPSADSNDGDKIPAPQHAPQKVMDPMVETLIEKVDGIGEQVKNLSANMRPEARRNRFMDDMDTQPRRCYSCQGAGHMARDCPYKQQGQRSIQPSQVPMFAQSGNEQVGPAGQGRP